MFNRKKISIVSSCYNEAENIEEFFEKVDLQLQKFKDRYDYEKIMVDNCSTDGTVQKLKALAQKDKTNKVIFNSRNFGHIRAQYHAKMTASGDAVIYLASDLQDPPELISKFIEKWEEGYKIVIGVKDQSKENFLVFAIRKFFYFFIDKISDDNTKMTKNFTGFGLYDRQIIDICKTVDDPYPYFRGLISEVGFDKFIIPFVQPRRKNGVTKHNFYSLYDYAMNGIIKHSKVPLRLMTFAGFILSVLSMFIAFVYLVYKLLFWQYFELGLAPIAIGLFFFASVQLFSIGILGEYIGAIYTRINKRPLVVEKERINF
ncbi:MAG: glycosyltransferase family 2 protein [Candidatus Gastranaerophilaceae bacterium]